MTYYPPRTRKMDEEVVQEIVEETLAAITRELGCNDVYYEDLGNKIIVSDTVTDEPLFQITLEMLP